VAVSGGNIHDLAITADLKISSFRLTNQTAVIGFYTFAGQHYSVEYSPGLHPESWTALPGGPIPGTGQDILVTDPDPVSPSTARFYRLLQ
jgi:hypothetical protein